MNKGFTLIEILIYSVIVTAIFGLALLATYQIIDSSGRVRRQRELTENQKFLIQKLTWVFQSNSTINSPALGGSDSTLSVDKLNFAGNPLVLSLNNGKIWLATAGGSPINLTNDYVVASDLIFDHLNFSGKSAIRFRLTLSNNISTSSIDTTIIVK